jgi:hypothetical protein
MQIYLGKWTKEKLDKTLAKSSRIDDPGERIDLLSKLFMNVKYKDSTLIGDINTTEVFVINFQEVDCFTYIDYIEAMRLSGSFNEFQMNLKKVRYKEGRTSFKNRKHFFTDWREFNTEFVADCTKKIGGRKARTVTKVLNQIQKGIYFLEGLPPRKRDIIYIPTEAIDSSIADKLMTGDYAGIYTEIQGLDVSHVGIIIKKGKSVYLRHASSDQQNNKVVEVDFKEYMSDKPGLVVLRPKA